MSKELIGKPLTPTSDANSLADAPLTRRRPWLRNRWQSSSWLLSGSSAVADQVIVSGLGFATSIMIGRESQSMLGVYYLALSLILFGRGIQESLVAAPFKVFCHRYDETELNSYAGSSVMHHLMVTGLMCGLLVLCGVLIPDRLFPAGLAPIMWVLATVFPLLLTRELFRQFSFARLRFGRALCLDAVVAIVQLAGFWLLSQHDMLTVRHALGVMAVACGIASIGWLFSNTQQLDWHLDATLSHWKVNWQFGRWAFAAQIIGSLAPYIVPWILSIWQDTHATGLFAACMTLVGASRVITDAVFNVLTPKSAKVYHEGGRDALVEMLVRWGRMFAILMGLFTLGTFVFGERLLVAVYGVGYAGTTWPLTILAAALWIHTIGFTCGDGLYVLERTRDNFWADVISTGLTVTISIPLVAHWDVLGAAISTFVALAAGAIARFFILRRCLAQPDQNGASTYA